MKITSYLFVYLITTSLISCNNERKETFVPEVSTQTKLMSSKEATIKLWKKAIGEGDFNAYNEISNAYILESKIYELYYYSLIMANKYKCPEAYYHLFIIMNNKVSIDGLKLYSSDEATKNMSLYYLLKSGELGYSHAQSKIDDVFGENKPVPSSLYYLKKSIM